MNKLLTLGVVVAIVLGGYSAFKPQVERVIEVGSVAGPDVYSYLNVHGQFQSGYGVLATSTADTTEVFQSSDLADYTVLDLNPITGATTYSLPATTSFPILITPGATRSWVFRNASTTGTNSITIAAGTGIDLQEPDGQNVVIGTDNFAWITCYRKANTDVVCRIDETIPAD